VDDLRPQINAYGKTFMKTPNLDRLAASGVLFERAYCMVPTCGASRAALMTSIRPAPSRFITHLAWADKEAPQAITLNTHFKANGYTTISLGKIFHHSTDSSAGWTEPAWRSPLPGYQDKAKEKAAAAEDEKTFANKKKEHRGPPTERFDAPDDAYPDGDCTNKAITYLEKFSANKEQPFFLAVGFLKPHLPFNAPAKYWDLYNRDQIDLPDNYHAPKDAPAGAVHNSGELRAYAGIPPNGPIEREMARTLIHGYYACVSFTDAQIGRLLDALEKTGLAKNTIVVLWGDHGWQLGEHGMWNKHSCFETSMHAPLLVRAPTDQIIKAGTRVSALTEFIDVYPTLCELTGLPIPSHVQGTSLVKLMRDPTSPWKPYAVGRFGAGDTIRSDTQRFSEYTDRNDKQTGRMLYDHQTDPHENTNVAAQKAAEAEKLQQALREIKGK
jgi:arylsulfatase A-like enzyme